MRDEAARKASRAGAEGPPFLRVTFGRGTLKALPLQSPSRGSGGYPGLSCKKSEWPRGALLDFTPRARGHVTRVGCSLSSNAVLVRVPGQPPNRKPEAGGRTQHQELTVLGGGAARARTDQVVPKPRMSFMLRTRFHTPDSRVAESLSRSSGEVLPSMVMW